MAFRAFCLPKSRDDAELLHHAQSIPAEPLVQDFSICYAVGGYSLWLFPLQSLSCRRS